MTKSLILLLLLLLLLLLIKHIWDPLITKRFFSLQLKSKNENAKSIYLPFKKMLPLKVRIKLRLSLQKLRLKIEQT